MPNFLTNFSKFLEETSQHDSFFRVIARDAIRLFPGLMGQLLGGLGVTVILGKYLRLEDMGLYTLYWITLSYIVAVFTGWLNNAIVRFLPKDQLTAPQFVKYVLVINFILLTCGLAICVCTVIWDIKYLYWGHTFSAVILLWSSSLFNSLQCVFRGVFDQKNFSTSSIWCAFTQVIALVVFLNYYSSDNVTSALAALSLGYLAGVLWQLYKLLILQARCSATIDEPRIFTQEPPIPLLHKSFKYGMPLSVSLLLITFLQTGDRYILASFFSLGEIGLYAFWMRIGLQLIRVMSSFVFMIINPRLFQKCDNDLAETKIQLAGLISLYLYLVLPLVFVIGGALPVFFSIVGIHHEYQNGAYLVYFALTMAFFLGLTQLTGKSLEFSEKTVPFIFGSLLGIIVMVIVSILLMPTLGIDAAATGTLAGYVAYYVVIAFFASSWPPLPQMVSSIFVSIIFFISINISIKYLNGIFAVSLIMAIYCLYSPWIVYRCRN